MNIKIGADELILWLRKNNKARNKKTIDLGKEILKLIESLDGRIIDAERDTECFWDTRIDSKNIGEFLLPKTAAQYEIDTERLNNLYQILNEM